MMSPWHTLGWIWAGGAAVSFVGFKAYEHQLGTNPPNQTHQTGANLLYGVLSLTWPVSVPWTATKCIVERLDETQREENEKIHKELRVAWRVWRTLAARDFAGKAETARTPGTYAVFAEMSNGLA